MFLRRMLFLSAALLATVACDDDSPPPQAPTASFDAGQGSQGTDGGATEGGPTTLPGPGPSVLGLALPAFYGFVTGLSGITSSGFEFLPLATARGEPVNAGDLQRVIFRLELNGSAQGRKANAIPVFVRAARKPAPNVGFEAGADFVCATRKSGSSGRTYRVLSKMLADPRTAAPYAENLESCSWFLVEVEVAGKKRYKPMIFVDGVEAYLSSLPSDDTSGRAAHVGSTFSDGATLQLLSPEHSGPIP